MSTPTFPVDPSNAEQAGDWDGAEGAYWATHREEYERLLGVFDTRLVDAGNVGAGDRCLDVGCGTGATSRALAARGGSVLGLDLSGPMLAVARNAAADLDQLTFIQGDAQVYPFEPSSFDVGVSRMGCMFFGDPTAAFANIGRALRPGGRLALTVWQEVAANEWLTALDAALEEPPTEDAPDEPAAYAPSPFSLADPDLCTSILKSAGYVDVRLEPLRIPLAFGSVADAQAFLDTWIDEDLDEKGRARVSASLNRLLVKHATSDGVLIQSATWLVTARRPSAA